MIWNRGERNGRKPIQLVLPGRGYERDAFRKSAQDTDLLCSTGGKKLAPSFLVQYGKQTFPYGF